MRRATANAISEQVALFSMVWVVGLAGPLRADDWPQFLGPSRSGASLETFLLIELADAGPPVVWRRGVGEGFAGPVVASNRLVLFHQVGDREVVECLDAQGGRTLWKTDYRSDFGGGMFREVGPRATPTIADGAVFTLGGGGVLHCLDFDTGAVRWRRDLHVDFHVPESFFGVACSPLVAAGKVFINVGAPAGAAFVALDCRTGKTAWTSANDEASYSSPVVTDAGDKQFVLFFARSGLHGVDLETGASRFFLRWRARIDASVNAAAPLVIGNRVFISASYNTGAALLRLNADGYDTLWTRTGSLDCHYNTAVYHEGHLYGVDGRQEAGAQLRCVELRTGKPVWTQPGYGCAAIILAEARLWVLGERGHLELVDATPTQFRSRGRSAVLSGVCRAHPALANGRYYARSATELVCLDLRRAK